MHTFTHSSIESASALDFLLLLSPAGFRVATPDSCADVENRSSAHSYGNMLGSEDKKKNMAWVLTLSHPAIQVRPTLGLRLMKSFCCRGHMGTFCRSRSQEISQKVPNSTDALIGLIVSSVDSPGQWCSQHKWRTLYQTGKDDVGLKLETGAAWLLWWRQ